MNEYIHTKQITAHFAEIIFEVDVLLQIYCSFPPHAHDFNYNT